MKQTLINPRTFLALLHDVTVAAIAWIAAYLLRFNFSTPVEHIQHTMPTPHEKLRIASARPVDNTWVKNLLKWINSAQSANEGHIKNELKFWVEEYSPQHQCSVEMPAGLDAEQVTLH